MRHGMILVVTALTALTAPAIPARADLTLKGEGRGEGFGVSATGETVAYIKGGTMRRDWIKDDKIRSVILDLGRQKMIAIEHAKKKAEIHDLAEMAADLSALPDGDLKVSLTPTGRTRIMLGRTCKELQVKIVAAYDDPSGAQVDTIISGPAWVAPDSPGVADYRAFYVAAAEKGLFFNQPALAKAQPGRAKGMLALYRALAGVGVPYASEFSVDFKGSGLLAQVMARMGDAKMSSTVSQVSTETLSEDLFRVPEGYKTKEK